MVTGEDVEVDIAVVGGGACGMMAALRAAVDPRLRIAVFEKSTRQGCNTQISSGSLAAGGTRFQRDAGVVDSPAHHAEDLLSVSGDPSSEPLVTAICECAPRYVEWLADELDFPMELGLDMARSGQSVPRLHTDRGRNGGRVLVSTLRRAIEHTPSIAFVDNSPGIGLLGSDEGVTGVEILDNGEVRQVHAATVVLATDGFAANPELLERYCPEARGAFYCGVSTSTGEALGWASALGADTANMAAFLGHGLVVVGHGTRLNPVLPFLTTVLVDAKGDRFLDERAQGYSKLGAILRDQPEGRAALIWDAPSHEVAMQSELMRESTTAEAYRRFEDLASLAEGLGLPKASLARSLAEGAGDPPRPLEFPLFGAWVTHGILTTQGGLRIDPTGRVLRSDASPIRGLFAGGGTAAGISGNSSEGYSSGNGLLAAMGLGWIIGNGLAQSR